MSVITKRSRICVGSINESYAQSTLKKLLLGVASLKRRKNEKNSYRKIIG
jgi:hypothetical protein